MILIIKDAQSNVLKDFVLIANEIAFSTILVEIIWHKLTHTLVVVRLAWTNGVNYNFFGGIAKRFVREKNWSWRSSLTFVSFGQAKEKEKMKSVIFVEELIKTMF